MGPTEPSGTMGVLRMIIGAETARARLAVIVALVVFGDLAWLGGGARAESPGAWQRLMSEVETSWEHGLGRAADSVVQAAVRAEGRVAGAMESLIFEVSPEVSPGASLRGEVAVAAGLELRVMGTGFLGREAASRRLLARADSAARKASFVRGAIVHYAAWLMASLQASHLGEHLSEVQEGMAPLREAVKQKLLPELIVDGLEVEVVRLAMAREAALTEVEVAAAGLASFLGREVAPATWGALPSDGVTARWGGLTEVRAHPELLRMEAEGATDSALAEVVGRGDDARLSVAATVRQVAEPEGTTTFGGVAVVLKVPLARAGAAEAERLRGHALAKGFEREARQQALVLEIRQRERQHAAWARELEFVRKEAEPRLASRVEKTAAAVALGRASAEALVMARRDLIELHHDEVRLIGLLAVSALESEAFANELAGTKVTQGDRP